MKIEIELSEVEALREKVSTLLRSNDTLDFKLKELNEKELIRKAIMLSETLFEEYMKVVFKKLGFNQVDWKQSVNISNNLERLGQKWWEKPDKIDVWLSAEMSREWKQAFLSIGLVLNHDKLDEEGQIKLP